MKKHIITILALLCLILSACSSSQAAAGSYAPAGDESVPVSDDTLIYDDDDPFSQSIQVVPDTVEPVDDIPQYADVPSMQGDDLKFEDFDFYYDIITDGIPEDAVYPTLNYGEGVWKYDLIFRYDTSEGIYYDELGYAELKLDYDREKVIITLHPRLGNDGYESWPTSDEEVGYEPFEGGFDDDGNLRLFGNDAVISAEDYYAYSGREYFISEMWISEESYGILLMTRGQD